MALKRRHFLRVPGERLELSRCCQRWVLNPLRLPFRHPGNKTKIRYLRAFSYYAVEDKSYILFAMSGFYSDAIFWVEVDKIQPNPYQPRKEFDEAKLKDLSGSIRQYGVLQPLVVTRREFQKDDGGLGVTYELIAGERRLRASRLAGLSQVPVIIRDDDQSDMMKLELAIIENLQREDLNAIDRARAFERLAREFNFKHAEIAKKVGKSREYVSNTIRLLALPEAMQTALSEGRITEGHTRPLLMLTDRREEQDVLFREIMLKKLTVREAEGIARRIAFERARKKERMYDPDIIEMEQRLTEALGTRVAIETKEVGGKLVIDFFSDDDLRGILAIFNEKAVGGSVRSSSLLAAMASAVGLGSAAAATDAAASTPPREAEQVATPAQEATYSPEEVPSAIEETSLPIDDMPKAEAAQILETPVGEDDFDPKNFAI